MSARIQAGLVVLTAALLAGAAGAQDPAPVSPGSSEGTQIRSICPTFSWDATPGAKSHELVVYRVGDDSQEASPVLRETIPGAAGSWTPPLDRCFERGSRYAWAVRAVGAGRSRQWSSPALFEVLPGPSEVELEEALARVREYLESKLGPPAPVARVTAHPAEASIDDLADGPPATRAAGVVPALSIDGPIAAQSFHTESTTTGYLGIPASAFVPASHSMTYNRFDGTNPSPIGDGLNPISSPSFQAHAPVYLPNGAVTVTNLTCYYSDRSAIRNADIRVQLIRRPLASPAPFLMAEVEVTTGIPLDTVFQYGTSEIADPVIANNLDHYYLKLQMNNTDPSKNLGSIYHHGCRIRYTWDRLAN